MRVTIIKGILKDRISIGFGIGDSIQTISVSYTELHDLLPEQDVKQIIETPFGIWNMEIQMRIRQ